MVSDKAMTAADEKGIFTRPWPALTSGLLATAIAFLLSLVHDGSGDSMILSGPGLVACVVLMVAGLLAAAAAVVIQPRSAPVLVSAGFVALVASLVTETAQWDSAVLLLRILMAVALVAAGVVLLPKTAQRIVISLVILFHFLGILSAVTNIDPAPWLSRQIWVYYFRPYLQFMYLNNAYHFYAPQPGPASLLWFRIEYEKMKGKRYWRWVKIPEVDDEGRHLRPGGDPLWPNVEYTRRLSIADSINQPGPVPQDFDRLRDRRIWAGQIKGIPLHPTEGIALQYHELPPLSRLWLESYVRYVASHFPHEQHPELKVTGVKAYLVIHVWLTPPKLAEGANPNDLSLYRPFYEGDFNPDGTMKGSCQKFKYDEDGSWVETYRDPFLYWLIPIVNEPAGEHVDQESAGPPGVRVLLDQLRNKKKVAPADEKYVIHNYLLIQAGDVEAGGQP